MFTEGMRETTIIGEGGHKRTTFSHTGGPGMLRQVIDGLSGNGSFSLIISRFADASQDHTGRVGLRVVAHGAAPGIIVPGDANREVAEGET
jgi:hypothetical protein